MESRVKLFGQAVIFDILYLATDNPVLSTVSFYMIAAGVVGGLLAAIFGLIDWLSLPNNSRAKAIGLWHGIGNVVIVTLFAVSWLLRGNNANFVPDTLALLLSFAGVAMALVTAWIGGELVYRLGVGVDPGANVNAPNSLTTSSTAPTKRTANR
jgi:uncharacterized membrane protein